MSWIALLLVGLGVTDLVRSCRPLGGLEGCVGGSSAVLLGLLAGLTSATDVVALLALAVASVAWGLTVHRHLRGGSAVPPLGVAVAAVVVALLLSGTAGEGGGAVGSWVDGSGFPGVRHLSVERVLLLVGVLLAQLSTGNVVVRLVLAVTGTVEPSVHDTVDDPEQQLKGGRLLGPMERLFIVGLGLAGELTAASIVIAAKGLLRWPELQSRVDQVRIHRLTEYFLVGSFVSWLFALSCLALARP
ncbi:hypothetical protein [Nocardioides aurantiacus]|uniref:Uncharacterized protein n=1 Tax=Nocardioides aurantiacus TaxID=86796 RepID=A0A3N2CS80_9ACTN|nr:hypothetical protein [Nocardioides aurantiacus]ROR90385.1 hypothetical protein EDD33_1225 [Nocardioides aurantiacus]